MIRKTSIVLIWGASAVLAFILSKPLFSAPSSSAGAEVAFSNASAGAPRARQLAPGYAAPILDVKLEAPGNPDINICKKINVADVPVELLARTSFKTRAGFETFLGRSADSYHALRTGIRTQVLERARLAKKCTDDVPAGVGVVKVEMEYQLQSTAESATAHGFEITSIAGPPELQSAVVNCISRTLSGSETISAKPPLGVTFPDYTGLYAGREHFTFGQGVSVLTGATKRP